MRQMAKRLNEFIEDIKIGIRYYRMARRYSRKNIHGITTQALKSSYEEA